MDDGTSLRMLKVIALPRRRNRSFYLFFLLTTPHNQNPMTRKVTHLAPSSHITTHIAHPR